MFLWKIMIYLLIELQRKTTSLTITELQMSSSTSERQTKNILRRQYFWLTREKRLLTYVTWKKPKSDKINCRMWVWTRARVRVVHSYRDSTIGVENFRLSDQLRYHSGYLGFRTVLVRELLLRAGKLIRKPSLAFTILIYNCSTQVIHTEAMVSLPLYYPSDIAVLRRWNNFKFITACPFSRF